MPNARSPSQSAELDRGVTGSRIAPRRGLVSRATFEAVCRLVDDEGIGVIAALRRVAEESGRTPAGVHGAYYRHARLAGVTRSASADRRADV